ncbi:MAG: tRNA-dihydrouridine synthase [Patescibacteria group bacterium]|jgi:tRNA-dihydrouridine synthase B|nr:tRNA-dihydrouridine synthase [Patescibacteria group bacterium]
MKRNFWQKLKKRNRPILALAPMAGFSDAPFRRICKKQGADVLYSEMASAAALYYAHKEKKSDREKLKTLSLLKFNPRLERPYIVQLFGSKPEHFAVAVKVVEEKVKPDGIDINFGCPVPKVVKQGAGSGLMKDLKRSREVLETVLSNTKLPVSVKIRLKAGDVSYLDFLKNIEDLDIFALMIHGRSLSQGFIGEVKYSEIANARKYFKGVILANGGINSLETANLAMSESKADGLGLARGVLGRPWLFKEIKKGREIKKNKSEVFKMIYKHAKLYLRLKGKDSVHELRKNLVWYLNGIEGASKIRKEITKIESLKDVSKILNI